MTRQAQHQPQRNRLVMVSASDHLRTHPKNAELLASAGGRFRWSIHDVKARIAFDRRLISPRPPLLGGGCISPKIRTKAGPLNDCPAVLSRVFLNGPGEIGARATTARGDLPEIVRTRISGFRQRGSPPHILDVNE